MADLQTDDPRTLGPTATLIGLAAITALRLVFAATIPLTEDEAYYRLWSQHLQLGYYDHPPMVAWAMALGRGVGGDTPLGVRWPAVIGSTLTSLLVLDVASLAGCSAATGRRAMLWYNAALLVGFGSILMIPDVAACLFWTLTLWCLLKARSRSAWWLAAGMAAGAATLSKYSALFLAPGVLWWLLRSQQGRRALRSPWPWAALALAGACFLLNVYWNASHGWLTFVKQFGRVAPRRFEPWRIATFLAAFALLVNPLVLPFLWRDVRRGVRPGAAAAGGPDLMLISGAPFFAYLCLHSLHSPVQAHWPAPLYPALAILGAQGASGDLGRPLGRLAGIAPWVGLSLTTLALIHLALPQTDWLGPRDPSGPLRGWPAFTRQIETLRVRNGASWIGAVSFGAAAQFADAYTGSAPVLQVTERGRYGFAPPPPAQVLARPGLVVDLSRRMDTARLGECFSDVRVLATIARDGIPGARARYTVVRVASPRRELSRQGCRSFHNGRADD